MRIAIDLDGTICELKKPGQSYADVLPNKLAVERIKSLKAAGHEIIILTARHMKTCGGNSGQVIARQGKITLDWLEKYQIPYDEIHFTKPFADVYIDDLAKRFNGWEELSDDYFAKDTVNILIPMAGLGSRFAKAGYTDLKPLIKVKEELMIEWAIKSFDFLPELPSYRLIFVVLEEHDREHSLATRLKDLFGVRAEVLVIPALTSGQAATCLAAKKLINNHNKLFIYNCDTYSTAAIWNLIQREDPDGIMTCFNSRDAKFSFADVDDTNHVKRTTEKDPISNWASTGLYYFRRGQDFVDTAEKMLHLGEHQAGEFYVAPLYNHLIDNGKRIKMLEVAEHWILGTPEDLDYFNQNYGR